MKKNIKYILPAVLIGGLSLFVISDIASNDKNAEIDTNTEIEVDENVDTGEVDLEVVGTIDEYFPMKEGVLAVYESDENPEYNYSIYNLYSDDNKVQRVITFDMISMPTQEVLEYREGKLLYVNGSNDKIIFDNMLDDGYLYQLPVLAEPMQMGTTWQSSNDSTSMISDVNVIVETPVDTFECVEVTTNYLDGTFQKAYFAKEVGLVKNINTTPKGEEVTHLLTEYTEDTHLSVEFPVFYHDNMTGELALKVSTIELGKGNDQIKEIEKALKQEVDGYTSVLGDATINYIEVYKDEGYAHIDLSNYNIEEYQGATEMVMLTGLVNSLCSYLKVPALKITVDGNYYESDDIGLLDYALEPNYENYTLIED